MLPVLEAVRQWVEWLGWDGGGEAMEFSRPELHILWCAMQAMVNDQDDPQAEMTDAQWDMAYELMDELDLALGGDPE